MQIFSGVRMWVNVETADEFSLLWERMLMLVAGKRESAANTNSAFHFYVMTFHRQKKGSVRNTKIYLYIAQATFNSTVLNHDNWNNVNKNMPYS